MQNITKNIILNNLYHLPLHGRDPQQKTSIKKNTQNISIENILGNLSKNDQYTDREIQLAYLEEWDELDHYRYVGNNYSAVQKGDAIRYSQHIDDLSSACMVLDIHPINDTVDYFLVKTIGDKPNIWKVYPETYVFFIRGRTKGPKENPFRVIVEKVYKSINNK